jgi:putative transposase
VILRPKYRRKILTGEVAQTLQTILLEITEQKKWPVYCLEIQDDHIHIFLTIPPATSVSNAVKILKGVSGYKILKKLQFLKEIVKKDTLCVTFIFCWYSR